MDKKVMKNIFLLITYFILLLVAVVKIDFLIGIIIKSIQIMWPIFIGVTIAFILNRPYNFFFKKYSELFKKNKPTKIIRPLALTTVYILFIGIITGIVTFIIPQLSDSIQILYINMSDYGRNLETFALNIADYLKLDSLDLSSLDSTIEKLPDIAAGFVTGLMPRIFDFTTSFVTILINIIIGFVLSIYLLADKERLKTQFIRIFHSYLSLRVAKRLIEILRITNETFTKFVSGQFTEAFILGILCFIGMLVFGFEYPILISVIIGITSLIPIVGSIIGLIPALFILLMIEPMQAVWFLLFIVLLQQIEGNFIYPKVVGDSVGLPPIWVLLAIIIGAGLFGVLGMLIGVPTVSVIYQLVKDDTNTKLKENK